MDLSHNYRSKDSFGDRIWDDLCEDILHWLPIEDKFKFSSVSKQFQRCLQRIRSNQIVLKVMVQEVGDRNNYNNLLKQWSHKSMDYVLYVDIHRLQRVLRLMTNIHKIYFDRHVFIANKEDVLSQLIESIDYLSSFSFNFCGTEDSVVIDFAKKFGPNLKSLDFCGLCDINRFLRFCPKLLSVSEIQFNRLFDSKEVLLKNTIRVMNVIGIDDKELFSIFVKNNPKLTHLDIRLSLKTSADTSDAIAIVSQLKDLKLLAIQLKDNDSYDNNMTKSVELIARKCPQLRCFELDVVSGQGFDGKHFSQAFKSFSSLKRLSFRSTENKTNESLDISCFENCKDLSHLTLMSDQIDDNFFTQISPVFPRLTSLKILLKNDLTDRGLESIAQLKCLESLVIRRFGGQQLDSTTDSGVSQLIDSCSRLHTVFIFNKTSVSELTIGRMIRKAIKTPGLFFKYYLPGVPINTPVKQKLTNICIAEELRVLESIKYKFN